MPVLVALALSACAAADAEKPHSYATGKDFTIKNDSDQVYYVTGLADAFTYLSAKTGYQKGLSDCYRKYDVSRPTLAVEFERLIKWTKPYDGKYDGPPLETLPAAEVFDKLSSLYCKDERTGAASVRDEKPHSYTTGKYVTIWSFADPANYLMGLADAFVFLSRKTGYRRGFSECYGKHFADRKELLASFRAFMKKPKPLGETHNDKPLALLPAAEVFDKFSSLFCKDAR